MKSFLEKIFFSLPAFILCGALLFPFLLFAFFLKSVDWTAPFSFVSVFLLTLFQASLSAFLSLFFGLLGSLGLLSLTHKKSYFLIEGVVLLPALIPPLILVLSLIHLFELVRPFPFGLGTLVFAQTLTYTGLCAVALARVLLREASLLSEWSYLHGSSRWLFIKTLLKSLLVKDMKILFALVFTGSFTSLSLPLLTAGSSLLSLEFFIYEKLKDPALWPQALSLILFQSFFVFFICWKVFSQPFLESRSVFTKIYLLPRFVFILIPLGAVFLSLGGLFFISDPSVFFKLLDLKDLIFKATLTSFFIGLFVGFLTLLGLTLMSLSFQCLKARKFVASFTPPGISFMGFAFLIWPGYGSVSVFFKWVLGLSLLFFPLIYRFRGERALESLSEQVETARFLGAGWFFIFQQILWPQSRSLFFLCAGLSSFWACGDFAYSLIVAGGHWNLSLVVYDLFSSYRLDEAIGLSWLLLVLSFSVLVFWLGVSFVFDKKFIL